MPSKSIRETDQGENGQRGGGKPGLSWVAVFFSVLIASLLSLAGLWLTSCQAIRIPIASPSPTPTVLVTSPEPSPTVSPAPVPTPTPPAVITLTLWTAPDFSPVAEGPAGEVMRQLLSTFNETQSEVKVQYVLKKPQGIGGLLDYLLTASSVAPGLLPDVIFLEPHALRDAARAELVRSLDDLLPPSLQEDLFPFALAAGRFDGQLKGIQFQTDALHLLYNTNKLESPPLTWTDVLTRPEARYLFPAGGQGGLAADSFLIHYLSTGAPLFGEIGQLTLDEGALTAVLGYYAAGVQSGVVPTTVLEIASTVDAWPVYLEAEVAMTQIVASHYLANRDVLHTTAYALIPGQAGPAPSVSQGWTVALVTKDPYRVAAGARFIEWWLSAANNANWNLAAGTLPVRRSAYQRLSEGDPYFAFLAELLETAQPYPLSLAYREVAAAWQIAVETVLNGEQTPEEAAAQVMATLGQ